MTRGFFSSRTVEIDLMKIQFTLAKLAFLRKLKVHRDRATTLVILDIDPLGRTGNNLVTRVTAWGLVGENNVGLPRSREIKVPNREGSIGGIHLEIPVVVSRQLSSNAVTLFIVSISIPGH
jgi:hypothetical protein